MDEKPFLENFVMILTGLGFIAFLFAIVIHILYWMKKTKSSNDANVFFAIMYILSLPKDIYKGSIGWVIFDIIFACLFIWLFRKIRKK